MDTRNNMIIAKGEPITSRVEECTYNQMTHKWDITFRDGKIFSYACNNIEWLKGPVNLNPKSYHISHKGKIFDNINAIFAFSGNRGEYWHICFSTGYENDYNVRDLTIEKSCLENDNSRKIFSYLQQIAENISVKTEDDTAILAKQYEKIDFLSEKNAVAIYLNPEKYKSETGLEADLLIFPFGCNKSQYRAVEQAILNHISVIEGPPGTGKTQTILNIIANLLIRKKTVQVVSNNNSAIENIIEKLSSPKYALDFFVASLGRIKKKHIFIDSQNGTYPDFSGWEKDQNEKSVDEAEIRTRGAKLQTIYEKQNRLAEWKEELKTVEIEQKHYFSMMNNMKLTEMALPKEFPSEKILQICQELEAYLNGESKMGFFGKLRFRFTYGFSFKFFAKQDKDTLIPSLQILYYRKKLSEIRDEMSRLEQALKDVDADKLSQQFIEDSLCYFRKFLADQYKGRRSRTIFEENDLWQKPDEFLKEYPVVLSTTYMARSSLGKNTQFDYVIMDEASQVDIATGALAMSCAQNAVIVGDNKQLPNVVTKQQKELLKTIFSINKIPDAYDYVKYSFLDSFYVLLGKRIPKTILSEHYRCDPQIIGYCNQKFYQNELIVMTEKHPDSLKLVTTVAGHHVREQANQRQAEVIKWEVLPELTYPYSEIGIISPYRNQVALLKKEIANPEIEIATVHKFQGREKNVIIFSTTDDLVTEFSDDPNLLNVAVSRAKKQLIIVASEMEQPAGSNVGDLIGYIRYHNCLETHSSISSVFDYLYTQNEEKRLEYLKNHKRISEYDSENLFFALIEDELKKRNEALGVVCHQPLYLLFRDLTLMSEEEKRFIRTGFSHIDFLIYNKVTKRPLLAIEVDGYNYHKADSRQSERDRIKDHILEVYHVPLIRFKTNGSREREILQTEINRVLNFDDNHEATNGKHFL
jgi:superfamily I DNA and/or RNA helicase